MLPGVGKLAIDLQGGFDDDVVVVTVNGRELLRRQSVITKRVLGLAARTSFDLDDGRLEIEVSVPGRGLSTRLEAELSGELHLGVSLAADGVRIIVRHTPFGYG
jgi:hypothetical protein